MRVLRVYSPTPCTPSRGGMVLLVGVLMLFCLGLSGQKVSLFQLRNAPDSTYVIGAGPGGVAKWVKKDSLGLMDSIYINGVWYSDGDTVEITDTYVQFFDGGSLQTITFTTGETIVFDPFTPEYAFLENVGGGYYRLKFTPTVIDTFERVGNKIRLSLASDNEFTKELTLDNTNQLGNLTIEGDSIYYQKCPYCIDSLIGVIVHPTTIDSTTVSSTTTVTLTEVANNITANVNDGSITPVKLDRLYDEPCKIALKGAEYLSKMTNDSLIDIIWIGDSRTQSGFVEKYRDVFLNKFGTAGYGGFPVAVSSAGFSSSTTGTVRSNTGSATTSLARLSVDLTIGQTITLTKQPSMIDSIAYLKLFFTGSVEVVFDGVTYTPTSGSAFGTGINKIGDIVITALGSSSVYELILTNSSNKGLVFHRMGNPGIGASSVSLTTDNYYESNVNPDAVFIRLGANDYGVSGSVYAGYLETIANKFDKDVVIINETDINNANTVNTPAFNASSFNLAKENGYGYIDFYSAVPNWKNFYDKGLGDTLIHENEAGAIYLAAFLNTSLCSNISTTNIIYDNDTTYVNGVGFPNYKINGTVSFLAEFGPTTDKLRDSQLYDDETSINVLNRKITATYPSALSNFILGNGGNGSMSGQGNYIFGVNSSASSLTSGYNNFLLGNAVAQNLTVGYNNLAIGNEVMRYGGSGSYNQIALGPESMKYQTGNNNVAIGTLANLYGSGTDNVAIGRGAMGGVSTTTAGDNQAIGRGALTSLTSGVYNTAVGSTTLNSLTTGLFNTAVSTGSLYSLVGGIGNTALGRNSGRLNTSGNYNIFLGYEAGYNETGSNMLYIDNTNTTTPMVGSNLSSRRLGINRNIASLTATMNVGGNLIVDNLTATPTKIGGVGAGNELTRLKLGNGLSITDSTLHVATNLDNDSTNEIQTIDTFSIVSNILYNSLSKDGQPAKTVNLAPYLDNTDAQNLSNGGKVGNNQTINISGGTPVAFSVADADSSKANELITSFTRVADSLKITDPGGTYAVYAPTSGGGTVTNVTASSPLASSGGTTPNLTIQNATTSLTGALTSTDWNTFNGKIGGSGTAGYYGRFSGTSTIGNAGLYQPIGLNPIGIGTTSPQSYLINSSANGLAIYDATNPNFSLAKASNYWLHYMDASNFYRLYNSSGGEILHLTPAGMVSAYKFSYRYGSASNASGLVGYAINGADNELKSISVSTGLNLTTGGVLTNTSPDQTVSITGAGISNVTGTYPNFTVTSTEVDGSTTNEIQQIDTFTIVSNVLRASLSSDGVPFKSVNLSTYLDNTDAQNLSNGGKTGNIQTINISGGTGTTINIADGDSSITNELQTIGTSGSAGNITLSNGGGTLNINVNDADASTTNELQTISTSGGAGNITLSGGGGTLNLNVNDADASATNELNVLSLGAKSGSTVPLNSSNSGGTINFIEGSGITLTRSVNDLTIASTATSDGNGIYDGSGSLSGNTTVNQGLNRYYHSTSTSGGVDSEFDLRYDYGYLGTNNASGSSYFQSTSGETKIINGISGTVKSYLRANTNQISIGLDSTYFTASSSVAKLKINNSFGTSGDVLYSGGSGSMYWAAPSGGGGISGLTTGYLPYASSGTTIADSPLYRLSSSSFSLGTTTNTNLLGRAGFNIMSADPAFVIGKSTSHYWYHYMNGNNYEVYNPNFGAVLLLQTDGKIKVPKYNGSGNRYLYSSSTGEINVASADAVSGSGTAGYLPRWFSSGVQDVSGLYNTAASGGVFGIGTTTPASYLVADNGLAISGTTPGLSLRNTSGYYVSYINGADYRMFSSVNGEVFTIKGGNFGINQTNPSQKLHVTGNALITGTLQVQTNGGTSIAMAGLTSDLKLASLGYSGNLNLSGGVLESKSTDIQTFTSSGTWTKPSGAKTVHIIMHGGGGGGGSGGYVSSTPASGGAGGGGGARTETDFVASLLSGTVSITVGGGGSAGSGVNGGGSDADGNYGSDGGFSSFGTLARAYGGDGGGPGITLSASVGGAGGPGSFDGGTGGAGGAPGANQGSQAPASKFASMGGNGGAGCSLTTTGSNQNALFAPFGGTPNSANYFGYGGTGGGSGSAAGGAGNTYGAGGGGGAAKTGTTSGSGGAGAAGIVIVITSF